MRNPAGGDPTQAGGDSTHKRERARSGGEPSGAARGDPGVRTAWGDPSVREVPSAPAPAPSEHRPRPRTPPGFEAKINAPPGHILLKEAQALVFDHWPAYHRFELWKSHFFREVVAKSGQDQKETMIWIKEIEIVTDITLLATSTTRSGLNFESLDVKIATGLWKILRGDFEKKLQIEERILQQSVPHAMLTGRQVSFRIFEHFKLPAARTAVLNINHLFAFKNAKRRPAPL